MKKILLLLLLPLHIFSQSSLSGSIKDASGYPIMGANVIAVNNETNILDGFGISNENGYFSINLKNGTEFNIKITFIGFKPVEFNTTLNSDTVKDFVLEEQSEALDAVEIVYEMPVEIRGDTIVYSADAFNTGTEKKLADVLKNLPGVEVNEDGRIEVEGQEVRKIQIEGKDFFDGDTKLAAQNLPAKAVGKIEVLRNFTEVGQLSGVQNNEDNFAINIRLREGKDKFWFGEILAGTGPDNIHLVAPKIFYYAPKFNFSVLANSNDIGQPPLSRRDFYRFSGGFGNLNSRTGTSINIGSDLAGIGSLNNNRAKSIDSKLTATNFSVNNDKGLEISGFTVHSSTVNELEEQIDRTYVATNAVENTSEFSLQENDLELYKFSLEYEPSEILQLEYNILFNKSNQYENNDLTSMYGRVGNRLEETLDITRSQKPQSLNQEFKLYFTLNEDHIFSFEAQHLDQEENPFNRAIRDRNPFTRLIPFSSSQNKYDITQERMVHTGKLEAKLDYYYLLNDVSNINISLGVTDVNQDFNSSFYQILDNGPSLDFNDAIYNNDVKFDFSDAYVALNYRLRTGIFTFDPGFTLHFYNTKNTQLGSSFERSMSDVRPNLRINLQFKKTESLRFTFRKNTQFTDVNNLAEGYVFNNYNSIFKGNRELESAVVNTYNLNYRSINQFTFTNIFANASYSKRSNSIQSRANIAGINAIRTSINSVFPRETYSVSGRIDKRFKNFKLNAGTRFNYSDFTNVINDVSVGSNSLTQNYSASIETNFRDKPNIELGYKYNINRYDNGTNENKFITESPFAQIDAYFGKGFVFTAEYSFNSYKNETQTLNKFRFLDADLSYNKEGSKWEFGVGVTNLLNDQSINRDSFNQFFSQTRMYVIQPRYILFKLKYDLTLFGGKDKNDENSSKAPTNSRPRGNRGGGRLR
tara:strand:- start:103 stop:2874 length:2772 start_codon:yes stop_codon:yes gene_type:complete